MKNFLLAFVISVLFVICLADTFPRSQLKKACKLKNGEDGTFELISKCDQARLLRRIGRQEEVEPVGVVRISRESVVCCAPRVERRPVNSENLTQSRSSVEKISYECFPYCLTLDNEIVSGEKAGAGDFPHMAAVGYFDDKTNQTDFKCGGSLISDRFVLTAAHCCSKKDESPYIVRLGRTSIDLNDANDKSVHFDSYVKKIYLPVEYKSTSKAFDIALLELETSVEFDEEICKTIKPACLNDKHNESDNREYTIIGFGRNDSNTNSRSNWLLNAIVTEVPLNECRKRYEGIQMIDETQLCAHDIINRSDACQGDSGSSLQVKHFDDFHIVGVTSFGVGCGSDIPAVYTRVSRFVHWISQIVWP